MRVSANSQGPSTCALTSSPSARLRSRHVREQQRHLQAAPLGARIELEVAVVGACDLLGNGEAQAVSFALRPAGAIEPLRHTGTLLGRDPQAVVLDFQEGTALTRAAADGDRPALGRVL